EGLPGDRPGADPRPGADGPRPQRGLVAPGVRAPLRLRAQRQGTRLRLAGRQGKRVTHDPPTKKEIAMRQILVLSVLVLAGAVPSARADDAKAKEFDRKVTDLVRQATDLYKNAKALHVEAAVETHVETTDQKRDIKSGAVYDLMKPNFFALETKLNGDAGAG